MNKETLRIVFMGTPEFAVPSLKILIENDYNVVGVITAPDRKSGRGQKISMSDVKEYALTQNLNILQPTNLKDEDFLNELKGLNANLQIVVAFRMLPEVVWNMPIMGTFNLHGSLLPNYRGAAPINWAIMNGEKETGVTTFFLQHQIDTGNIIFQEKEAILAEDNVGTLYERLMHKGANLVLKTVREIENGTVKAQPQILTGKEKEAPKLHTETCQLDWTWSSEKINNYVRGLSPYPVAFSSLDDKKLKIYSVIVEDKSDNDVIGSIITDNKSYLKFVSSDGLINVLELQMEGKKRMKTDEFLRGYKVMS